MPRSGLRIRLGVVVGQQADLPGIEDGGAVCVANWPALPGYPERVACQRLLSVCSRFALRLDQGRVISASAGPSSAALRDLSALASLAASMTRIEVSGPNSSADKDGGASRATDPWYKVAPDRSMLLATEHLGGSRSRRFRSRFVAVALCCYL